MANLGIFSEDTLPIGWFSEEGSPLGWFDKDILSIDTASGSLTAPLITNTSTLFAASRTSTIQVTASVIDTTSNLTAGSVLANYAISTTALNSTSVQYSPTTDSSNTVTANYISSNELVYAPNVVIEVIGTIAPYILETNTFFDPSRNVHAKVTWLQFDTNAPVVTSLEASYLPESNSFYVSSISLVSSVQDLTAAYIDSSNTIYVPSVSIKWISFV